MEVTYGKVPFLSYYAVNNGIIMVVVFVFIKAEKLAGAVVRDLNGQKKFKSANILFLP